MDPKRRDCPWKRAQDELSLPREQWDELLVRMDSLQGNDVLLGRGTLKDGDVAVRATVSARFVPAEADRRIAV
jgi:hypothetical protein